MDPLPRLILTSSKCQAKLKESHSTLLAEQVERDHLKESLVADKQLFVDLVAKAAAAANQETESICKEVEAAQKVERERREAHDKFLEDIEKVPCFGRGTASCQGRVEGIHCFGLQASCGPKLGAGSDYSEAPGRTRTTPSGTCSCRRDHSRFGKEFGLTTLVYWKRPSKARTVLVRSSKIKKLKSTSLTFGNTKDSLQ